MTGTTTKAILDLLDMSLDWHRELEKQHHEMGRKMEDAIKLMRDRPADLSATVAMVTVPPLDPRSEYLTTAQAVQNYEHLKDRTVQMWCSTQESLQAKKRNGEWYFPRRPFESFLKCRGYSIDP